MQIIQLFVKIISTFCVQYLKLDWFSGSKFTRTIFCTSVTNDLCIAARNDKMYYSKNGIIRVWLIVLSAMKGRVEGVRNSICCQSVHLMELSGLLYLRHVWRLAVPIGTH